MPNFVQEYRNTDVGMPVVNGTAGSLIAMLDAVLVNGGAAQPVTSLTEVGATINAVIPADISLEDKDWLVIAGAAPAGANGTVQITFTDSTHFSYVGPGGLGAITGSITYKRAPLGWTKFAGVNVAAYRCAAVAGCPQFYLRVDETGATTGGQKEVAVRGYESMTDVNTGTGPFPTVGQAANGVCWRKSLTADAVARSWSLIGDGATFYFVINSDVSTTVGRWLMGFGAFTSFKPADAYNCMISGSSIYNSPPIASASGGLNASYPVNQWNFFQSGFYAARSVSQAAGSMMLSHVNRSAIAATALGSATMGVVTYPCPADGALWVESTMIFETTSPRGRPRGLYSHAHAALVFPSDYDIAINIAGLPGVTLLNYLHNSGNVAGCVQFDRYGPW